MTSFDLSKNFMSNHATTKVIINENNAYTKAGFSITWFCSFSPAISNAKAVLCKPTSTEIVILFFTFNLEKLPIIKPKIMLPTFKIITTGAKFKMSDFEMFAPPLSVLAKNLNPNTISNNTGKIIFSIFSVFFANPSLIVLTNIPANAGSIVTIKISNIVFQKGKTIIWDLSMKYFNEMFTNNGIVNKENNALQTVSEMAKATFPFTKYDIKLLVIPPGQKLKIMIPICNSALNPEYLASKKATIGNNIICENNPMANARGSLKSFLKSFMVRLSPKPNIIMPKTTFKIMFTEVLFMNDAPEC